MALKTLCDWMELLSGSDKIYKENTLTVHVYGEQDQSYIVVECEVSNSPRIVDQYTLHGLKENALFSLVCFLNDQGFDLERLVSSLVEANYIEDGMNDIAQFESVEVAKYQIQEN